MGYKECIIEAVTDIRHEMQHIRQKHWVEWHLVSCMQLQDGLFWGGDYL